MSVILVDLISCKRFILSDESNLLRALYSEEVAFVAEYYKWLV